MPDAKLFVFEHKRDARVLVATGDTRKFPTPEDLSDFSDITESLGRAERGRSDGDVWAQLKEDVSIPDGYEFISRRDTALLFEYELFVRLGVSFQIMNLHRDNKFCGVCGNPMNEHDNERAMLCASCGHVVFPTICPAVIVSVLKDDMLLMGHGVNFRPGMYSVLAGFVEPGETLEQAVAREIYEESTLRVKNIRYFGSQPWPFPCSLMLGFRCEWESGEPTADGTELEDVRWFKREELPEMPQSVSISRHLIDHWRYRKS